MEDITALEIKELIGKESEVKDGYVLFECSLEEAARYSYLGQGVNRVVLLDDDISKYGKTFRVNAEVRESELDRRELELETAEKFDLKVDLKNPDVVVYVFVNGEEKYIGIDFSGDLSKRDYKIKLCRDDLKGTIAYALVRMSGYGLGRSFLNLNAKSGTIAIEAALFGSGKSVNYYNKEKFRFLKFMDIDLGKFDLDVKEVEVYASDAEGYLKLVKSNAKIAGVKVKFENKDFDCVVKYSREKAEIKNLDKERKIAHGKEVLKITS